MGAGMLTRTKVSITSRQKYSWMVRYLNAMFEAMRVSHSFWWRSKILTRRDRIDPSQSQKSNINFHQHIGRWIREKGDAWDDTGEKVYWVALGPWEEDGEL